MWPSPFRPLWLSGRSRYMRGSRASSSAYRCKRPRAGSRPGRRPSYCDAFAAPAATYVTRFLGDCRAFAGREDNPNKGSRRGHRGRARKPYRRTMPPCHLRLTQADQTLQPRFHTAYTRSGPSHVKAASLRASNAIGMSEAPPNTMSIPRRPSAQNGRMGHSKCFGLALVRPGQATHRSSRAWLPRYVRDRKLDLDINSLAPPCRQFQPRRDRHGRMDIRND